MKEVDDKEKKDEEKTKVKKSKVWIIIICALIIIVAVIILAVAILSNTKDISKTNNLSNLGLVTSGDDYTFYYKDGEGIIKKDSNQEVLISEDKAYSMYYDNNYLFYTTPSDMGGLKIIRLTDDGSQSDTLVNTSSSSLKAIYYDGYIYYLTIDPNTISKIDINGENEEVLLNRQISDFSIYKDKIYFLDEFYYMYSIDLNGENYETISEEKLASSFQIYKGDAYFYQEDTGLMKLNLKKDEVTLVSDIVNSDVINVTNKGIFYLDKDSETICEVSLDGDNYKEIVVTDNSNTYINIDENSIYYVEYDIDENSYKTCRVNLNGKTKDEIIY